MEYAALAISLLGLTVAAATLYSTHLRSPKIRAFIGRYIKIYYPHNGGLGLYVPATFINTAPRIGAVLKAAILNYHKSSPQERFFMEWGSFSRYAGKDEGWVYENLAHAFPVPGKSSVSKLVWFNWLTESSPGLVIHSGTYDLTFFYWVNGQESPNVDNHELQVSEETFEKLEKYRTDNKNTTIDVPLDNHHTRNRLMTLEEVAKLKRGA